MFLSVIPPLDDDSSRSVVNIYIHMQLHTSRTSQSDEMIERNRVTFCRMEEYILFF